MTEEKETNNQGGMQTNMRQIFAKLKNVVSTEWNSDAPAVFDEFIREHEWDSRFTLCATIFSNRRLRRPRQN